MRPVFADTSFYIAFANPADEFYAAACDAGSRVNGRMVTTDCVLVELGNYFRSATGRELFLTLWRMLRDDAGTEIVPCSPEILAAGVRLYGERMDKTWSLTDCVSMAVMQRYGIQDALTSDHHFAQAGFNLVMSVA